MLEQVFVRQSKQGLKYTAFSVLISAVNGLGWLLPEGSVRRAAVLSAQRTGGDTNRADDYPNAKAAVRKRA